MVATTYRMSKVYKKIHTLGEKKDVADARKHAKKQIQIDIFA